MDLTNLSTPTPHPLKQILNKYNRGKISKELGIQPTYLGNILNGHYQPGASLEKRMNELADQIKVAEQTA